MIRRGAAALGVAVLALGALAGCSGGGDGAPETSATGEASPAATLPDGGTLPTSPTAAEAALVLQRFVAAAGDGDAERMWKLLSEASRRRLGQTPARFELTFARELTDSIRPFAVAGPMVLLALKPAPGWALVALTALRRHGETQRGAYASALRLDGDGWRVEIGGQVRLTPDLPADGVLAGRMLRLGVRVEAAEPITNEAVWIDGIELPALAAGPDERNVIIAGPPSKPLARGVHVGVAFATTGDEASAQAWTFLAR